jgi:hypothetical protein
MELKAGVNVLIFKVVNEVAGWEGLVPLTDPDGKHWRLAELLPPDVLNLSFGLGR